MGFTKGDKVIMIRKPKGAVRFPEINNEIVTIKGCCAVFSNSYDLEGYERSGDGLPQSFQGYLLRKVEPFTNAYTKQLANTAVREVKKIDRLELKPTKTKV